MKVCTSVKITGIVYIKSEHVSYHQQTNQYVQYVYTQKRKLNIKCTNTFLLYFLWHLLHFFQVTPNFVCFHALKSFLKGLINFDAGTIFIAHTIYMFISNFS